MLSIMMFKLNVTNTIVRCFYSPLIFLLPKVYHDINIFNKQKTWLNHELRMARTNYRRQKEIKNLGGLVIWKRILSD
jgi:hypothetical protein